MFFSSTVLLPCFKAMETEIFPMFSAKGDCAVAGGTDGSLFKFEGRNLDVVAPEAHLNGPVSVAAVYWFVGVLVLLLVYWCCCWFVVVVVGLLVLSLLLVCWCCRCCWFIGIVVVIGLLLVLLSL